MKSWQSKELKCCWNAVKRNYASAKNDVYKRETALSVVALAFLLFVIIFHDFQILGYLLHPEFLFLKFFSSP